MLINILWVILGLCVLCIFTLFLLLFLSEESWRKVNLERARYHKAILNAETQRQRISRSVKQ